MDNKKIGQFIAELRKEQGLNQKELAEKLSVTDKAVSKWETGRGIPDISMLQPLSEVFGVSIAEILNGERAVNADENDDEKIVKKLKLQKYIRLVFEGIITAIFAYVIYLFIDTFKMDRTVINLCLHMDELRFISTSTIVFSAITVLWLLVVVITAIIKRKASVLKTIIFCCAVFFVLFASVHIANMEDNRSIEILDSPTDTVEYVKYETFFDDEYNTQISIEEGNDKILEYYTTIFESTNDYNFVYTTCIKASEESISNALYYESKAIYEDSDITELTKEQLCSFDADQGYYLSLYENGDIELVILKDFSYYKINVSNSNVNDEKLIEAVKAL